MSQLPLDLQQRAETYSRQSGLTLRELLGKGKDGHVWSTAERSAVKAHGERESYRHEINAYIRFMMLGLEEINGFNVPTLLNFDDDLLIIEMSVVRPPFIVDFASARLDKDPGLIEDPDNTFEDFVRSRFDDRTDEVMSLYYALIAKAKMYLIDLHPQNIKFAR